jgi:hypothetical protein
MIKMNVRDESIGVRLPEVKTQYCAEFGVVLITELIMAIMADGRWYSATVLRKRIRPSSRGVITGTLAQLRRQGCVIRAKNPLDPGRAFHRQFETKFLYKANSEQPRTARMILQEPFRVYLQTKTLPARWREVLK